MKKDWHLSVFFLAVGTWSSTWSQGLWIVNLFASKACMCFLALLGSKKMTIAFKGLWYTHSEMIDKLPPDTVRLHKGISFTGITTCFFCHDGAGNIFMAKRSSLARDEQNRWDVGGGGLKWGVSAEDNVKREIEEEYGSAPLEIQFIGYRDAFRTLPDDTVTHWVALDFLVQVNRDEIHINEPKMFDESGWFTLQTLPSPLHSQLPYAFEKYNNELSSLATY